MVFEAVKEFTVALLHHGYELQRGRGLQPVADSGGTSGGCNFAGVAS
jgi:hypothetical protein